MITGFEAGLESITEQIAQKVADRVLQLLPVEPAEWAEEIAKQAYEERQRVKALIDALTTDAGRRAIGDYLKE